MKIVIPDPIEIHETHARTLRGLGAQIYEDMPKDQTELIDRIKDAEIITANYVDITKEVIDSAPQLQYIVVPAVGYEWVDVAYARGKGIRVLNCPTFNSQAVAEHAIALLLAVDRQIVQAAGSLQKGSWEHDSFEGIELHGKNLGLIGHGNIGTRIEKMLSGFEVRVTIANSKSTPEEIDELMRTSDFICICAPLTDKTKHMVDERRLALLKKSAVLVNVGRGAVIDQSALTRALAGGDIRSVGLDVFEGEPLTGRPSSEIVHLANLPNVVATPHIAYHTKETAERLGQELCDAIQSCLAGKPVNLI